MVTEPKISIIIPAYNEEKNIGVTLKTIHTLKEKNFRWDELIVVDDGSRDRTCEVAQGLCDKVLRQKRNLGKGNALNRGVQFCHGDILLFLDADLRDSAQYIAPLVQPLIRDKADMTVAVLPTPVKKGGFGLVKNLARQGIFHLSGYRSAAPLSGQRAIKKSVLDRLDGFSEGFGIEVGLTIDVARLGYRILEVCVPLRHRETGRDWRGFIHRGKQFTAVGKTLWSRWRRKPSW